MSVIIGRLVWFVESWRCGKQVQIDYPSLSFDLNILFVVNYNRNRRRTNILLTFIERLVQRKTDSSQRAKKNEQIKPNETKSQTNKQTNKNEKVPSRNLVALLILRASQVYILCCCYVAQVFLSSLFLFFFILEFKLFFLLC